MVYGAFAEHKISHNQSERSALFVNDDGSIGAVKKPVGVPPFQTVLRAQIVAKLANFSETAEIHRL